jgi:hypothetical protein
MENSRKVPLSIHFQSKTLQHESRLKFPQTNLLIAKVLATNLAYLNFVADLVDSDDLNQNFEMIVYRFWEGEQKSVGHRSMR